MISTLIITVNKREMTFLKHENKEEVKVYTLPTLAKCTGKREMRWKIFFCDYGEDGVGYYTESWQHPNGKVKTSEMTKVMKGKNIGRSNETTPFEQCAFTVYSLWTKKRNQEYNNLVEVYVDEVEHSIVRPMLAHPYDKRKHHLTEPFGASPKLDGVRALATLNNDVSDVFLYTRNAKPIHQMQHIKKDLFDLLKTSKLTLDGELYSHTIPFNEISGAVRVKSKPSPLEPQIQYWIFDYVDVNTPYTKRVQNLRELIPMNHLHLRLVDYIPVTHAQVQSAHDEYVQSGFEGVILRQLDAMYESNRSNSLLKYKEFQDIEFPIIDVTEGVGSEAGAILYICVTENGQRFTVRPRGSKEDRKEKFTNSHQWKGKTLTVRFQERDSVTSIPRFPVGIAVRDYE